MFRSRGPFGGIEVLDGRTGQSRWNRKLRCMDKQIERFIIGPDINADGHFDIYVASFFTLNSYEPMWMYVDALSGKDGRSLWWSRQNVGAWGSHASTTIGGLRTWNNGSPQLLVPVVPRPDLGRTSLFVFDAANGRLAHSASQVGQPRLADGDGDGLHDLYTFAPATLERFDTGGQLRAFRGSPSDTWRRLGRKWKIAEDYDGDGVKDLLNEPHDTSGGPKITALSAREGKVLWQHDPPLVASLDAILSLRQDLDGDQTPDILITDSRGGARAFSPFHALSGRTGRLLWSSSMSLNDCTRLFEAECRDLDGDGRPEVVFIGEVTWSDGRRRDNNTTIDLRIWLVIHSGRTGEVLWKQPLSKSSQVLRSTSSHGQLRPAYADLDRDGVLDVVVPTMEPQATAEFRAFGGADGKLLWQHSLSENFDRQPVYMPVPIASDLDHDGSVEILFIDYFKKAGTIPNSHRFGKLVVLNGDTGQPKWDWTSTVLTGSGLVHGSAVGRWNRPVPLVLNLPGDERQTVCVWFGGTPGEVAVLDSQGNILQQFPVQQSSWPDQFRVWPCDIDGDGGEELILKRDGSIQAFKLGSKEPLWRSPLPDESGMIVDVYQDDKGRSTTVGVLADRTVLGIDVPTGKRIWRCDGPNAKFRRTWQPPISILDRSAESESPQIVFHLENMVTVCRPALAESGRHPIVSIPQSTPTSLSVSRDPRLARQLPWVDSRNLSWIEIVQLFATPILLSIVLFIIPGFYVYALARRRRWSLRAFLLLPMILLIALSSLQIPLADAPTDLSPLTGKIVVAQLVLPGVMFTLFLIVWACKRRWRRVSFTLGLTVFVALLIVLLTLWTDSGKLAGEHYSLGGWYMPIFMAGYGVGIGMLIGLPAWHVLGYLRRQLWTRPVAS